MWEGSVLLAAEKLYPWSPSTLHTDIYTQWNTHLQTFKEAQTSWRCVTMKVPLCKQHCAKRTGDSPATSSLSLILLCLTFHFSLMQKGRTVPDLTQTEKIHCTEKNTQCLRSFWMQGNIFLKTLLMLSFMFVCQSGLLLLFRVRVQW